MASVMAWSAPNTGTSLDGSSPTSDPTWRAAVESLQSRSQLRPNEKQARNVILFVGDGMSIATITAARIYDGQSRGEPGEENVLSFERFPYTALVKTYNLNQQVPDSAGTASAMNTGVKTRAGVINVSVEAHRGDCKEALLHAVPTLAERAERLGKSTGIVTTARLTHATPAAVYAHSADRDWEADSDMPEEARLAGCVDIARQFVDFEAGDGIDVALGGGRARFLGMGKGGKRLGPNDDLIAEWRARTGGAYVTTDEELRAARERRAARILGLFSEGHMTFVRDRRESREPTLSDMTAAAIELLSRNPQGYYLMVESGKIDLASHYGLAAHALAETQALSQAVQTALSMVDLSDTLILVTADHAHTLTIAGYPTRGNPILGLVFGNDKRGEPEATARLALDGKPYTTLGYMNGPGAVSGERPAPELAEDHYKQQALVPTYSQEADGSRALSETHGGEDVALFAIGPRAYLVGGTIEQNLIYHIIEHAYGSR